jgi:hypothetical protein
MRAGERGGGRRRSKQTKGVRSGRQTTEIVGAHECSTVQIVIQCGRKAMFPCHSQHGGIAGCQSMLVGTDVNSKVVCAGEILVVVLFPYSAVLIDALNKPPRAYALKKPLLAYFGACPRLKLLSSTPCGNTPPAQTICVVRRRGRVTCHCFARDSRMRQNTRSALIADGARGF